MVDRDPELVVYEIFLPVWVPDAFCWFLRHFKYTLSKSVNNKMSYLYTQDKLSSSDNSHQLHWQDLPSGLPGQDHSPRDSRAMVDKAEADQQSPGWTILKTA